MKPWQILILSILAGLAAMVVTDAERDRALKVMIAKIKKEAGS